jgi:hypothetical protein
MTNDDVRMTNKLPVEDQEYALEQHEACKSDEEAHDFTRLLRHTYGFVKQDRKRVEISRKADPQDRPPNGRCIHCDLVLACVDDLCGAEEAHG